MEKVLELLYKNKDSYVSGEELANLLKVSRTAIWKKMNNLKELGYMIESHPHLGYQLVSSPDKLISMEIKLGLNTKFVGRQIFSFRETGSTNDVAMDMGNNGAEEGTVVFAETQTRGRGRLGRSWFSTPEDCVLMSVILRPEIMPSEISKITLVAAVGVAEAIREETGLRVSIKWPNDILIDNKKVCGILTEMEAEVDLVKFVVIGIGLNVSMKAKDFSGDLRKTAASIQDFLDHKIAKVDLARGILEKTEEFYRIFKSGSFSDIVGIWKNLSVTLGKRVTVKSHGKMVEGYAMELDSDGALMLRLDNGVTEKIVSGDVEVVV